MNCNEIYIKQPFLRRYKNIGVNQHFPENSINLYPPPPPLTPPPPKKNRQNNRIKINTINPEVITCICRSCYALNTFKKITIFSLHTWYLTFNTYTIFKYNCNQKLIVFLLSYVICYRITSL